MKKTLTLLVASTALTAAIGVPAWSAMRTPEDGSFRSFTAFLEKGAHAVNLILASDDDDDDDEHGYRDGARRGHDDDDDDCGDEHGDDDDCRGGTGNPAPAGSAAPPQNGLFENGASPQVQVN